MVRFFWKKTVNLGTLNRKLTSIMKIFYSIIGSLFVISNVFAQGVNPTLKQAQKKLIDSSLPKVVKSSAQLRSAPVVCDDQFYCEDFEGVTAPALPTDMTSASQEANYFVPSGNGNENVGGFYTGTSEDAGAGGYWTYLDEHTTFAMTNDDACLPGGVSPNNDNNCDLSFEVLELPEFDFTDQAGLWILFDYYHDKNWNGGDASVEITTDGENWVSLSDGPLPEDQSWQSAAYDLSSYEGETTVKIRFIWSDNGSWASGFAIDDIVINPLPEFDMKLSNQFQVLPSAYFGGNSYPTVPLTQVQATSYYFSGYIKNMGLNTLDSARLKSSIVSEGYNSESYGQNTISLDQDTFLCNDPFVPSATGTYSVDISGSDDNQTTTETNTVDFIVSEFDFARDNADFTGDYTSGSFINNDGDEQRGNVFDIYADATLYALKVRIHPNTSPNSIAKGIINTVIPNDDPNTPTEYAFFTETPEIKVGAHTDGWVNLMFDPPVQLYAGDLILATIYSQYNGVDTLVIGTSGSTSAGETMLQDISGTQPNGNPGDWYYTTSAPMIRLNFDPNSTGPAPIASVNELANKAKFNVYPNPNNGTFNVSISNTSESQIIEIKNILGQTVYTEGANNSSINQIDLSSIEKGIYTISLVSESGVSTTEKIIIQ